MPGAAPGRLTARGSGRVLLSWECLSFCGSCLTICGRGARSAISYELIARDRLAVGDALKRVSLGYFAQMNTGNILNSITTGLGTLENMGIRMIDNFVGGYSELFVYLRLFLLFFNPVTVLIVIAAGRCCLRRFRAHASGVDSTA